MSTMRLPLALLVACLFAAQPSSALPPLDTPYHTVQGYFFPGTHFPADRWDVNAGSWAADGQTFNVTAPAPSAISTINIYFSDPFSEPHPVVALPSYVYRIRLMNESTSADARAGLVYNYQDANNYYELVFSPTGVVQARRVLGGVVSVLVEKSYAEGGKGRWLDAELFADRTRMTLVVNGTLIVRDLVQAELPGGRLGLVAHNTTARFDAVRIDRPTDTPLKETFSDGIAQQFSFDTNDWKIENGVLKNFTVRETNKVVIATQAGWYGQSNSIRVRLRNPYGGKGNLVGVFPRPARAWISPIARSSACPPPPRRALPGS